MKEKKVAKVIAVSLLTSLVLAGCGETSDTKSSNQSNNSKTSSLHILPVMSDEDGNVSDAKATYTLKLRMIQFSKLKKGIFNSRDIDFSPQSKSIDFVLNRQYF